MDQVVQDFSSELRQRLGSRVRQILLFGLRARGIAREDSDYDMLVVVDYRTPEIRSIILDVERKLTDRCQPVSLHRSEEWIKRHENS